MTKTRLSIVTAAAMVLMAIATVGCSDGASRLSPIGPSPVAEAPAPPSPASAALSGWAAANGWSTMAADGRVAVADGLLVEGVDVVASVAGNCPSRTVTVRGVPVAVTASTVFSSPLTCSSLAGGMTVKVTGLLTYTASGFTVSAVQLASVGNQGSRAPSSNTRGTERVGGEGVVGAVSGMCPTLTMVVTGHRVQTTSATQYVGGSCETVREGMQVKLDVEKHADGSLVAEKIEFAGHRQ